MTLKKSKLLVTILAAFVALAVNLPGSVAEKFTPREALARTLYSPVAPNVVSYANVVVVAKSGGDFTTIGEALNSITGNSPTNRYLVWVAPGTYTERLWMKEYVDIEGAGEGNTKITFTGNGGPPGPEFALATVAGANNSELRFLTVENTGGDVHAFALFNGEASPSLLHVTLTASGGTYSNYGVYGIGGFPNMTNVTVNIPSGGTNGWSVGLGIAPYVHYPSPKLNNVNITISGGGTGWTNAGIYNDRGSPTMTNVNITVSGGASTNYGVYNYGSSTRVRMSDVTTTLLGATGANYGVYNDGGEPTMSDVTVNASGSNLNVGVWNTNCFATMNNLTATVEGGTSAYGVYTYGQSNNHGSLIRDSRILAKSATYNYGFRPDGYAATYIDRTTLVANTNTIYRPTGSATARVGGSQLSGGPVFGGNIVCAATYDENYTFYTSYCP